MGLSSVLSDTGGGRRGHRGLVAGMLFVSALLAVSSLVGDSLTFDETIHLTAGISYLETGDYRLSPETPPLAQAFAALPLLLLDQEPPGPASPGWRSSDIWRVGRHWLYDLNDGEHLLMVARLMMVLLLLATSLSTYFLARAIFGPRAALLALLLATLSPTYLAHGRLVTTDMSATLVAILALLAVARLSERFSWARLLLACTATAAASLVKFSWPILVPAYVLMGLWTLWHDRSWRRGLLLVVTASLICISTWASIWACFGFRYSPFRGERSQEAMVMAMPSRQIAQPASMGQAWETVFFDEAGRPMTDSASELIRFARRRRLLPESYLYGMAYTMRFPQGRPSYLNGRISTTASAAFFPVAFLLKTPVPTMLLLVAGLLVLAFSKLEIVRNRLLFAGLATYCVVYAIAALSAGYNLGHRHLLPLYPAVFAVAGAAALVLPSHLRWFKVAPVVLLVALPTLSVWPHFLSFFNVFGGGMRGGYRHLLDSNLDWGQDLKRLASYAREKEEDEIKLAYFGSADPTRYGFRATLLPSFLSFEAPDAVLGPGTYVISATQLAGLYKRACRRESWRDPALIEYYGQLVKRAATHSGELAGREAEQRLVELRPCRLIAALSSRDADDRIGASLFVFRLDQGELDQILAP